MKHNLLAGIPEEFTRFTQLPNEKGHNAVWDFKRSPEGRFFVSVCGESEMPLSALLYEYYPKDGGIRLICDIQKEWIVNPEQMPPSKIHTSIDFLPDGRLIMATHNTSPAANHKRWLYEQHYEHTWEGYAGSIVLIVNPDTSEVQVKGIPVPRESIYGGILGDDSRYYYFLGYMRGHFYRLDLETNEVKDYGKISEFASCKLIKDKKGRIYGGSYTGELWRYNPYNDKIEDLKVFHESPYGTKNRRQMIFALNTVKNTLLFVANSDGDLIELDPETLEVTRHGYVHLRPQQPRKQVGPTAAIGGFEADENSVLYYGLDSYHDTELVRLVRWDIFNGGEPENLGIISPHGKQSQYVCEMLFDNDGILHIVDVCGPYSPYILSVDVKKLREPGEDAVKAVFKPLPITNLAINNDRVYFSHINAEKINTFALHKYLPWKDSAVKHLCKGTDGLMYGVCGDKDIGLISFDFTCQEPKLIKKVYEMGCAISCIDTDNQNIIALTEDKKIVYINLHEKGCTKEAAIPKGFDACRIHFSIGSGKLLLSDKECTLAVFDYDNLDLNIIEGAKLQNQEAIVINLSENEILFSGYGDQLLVYDFISMKVRELDIRSSSIKGRAFSSTITAGLVKENGIIICGTLDGMLFEISPELDSTVSYGRLYSTGQLRGFVSGHGENVWGIYGGLNDAGHIISHNNKSGLIDVGKARVNKEDSGELAKSETEWASIHYISCISYIPEEKRLYVASGEQYGCIMRYEGVII